MGSLKKLAIRKTQQSICHIFSVANEVLQAAQHILDRAKKAQDLLAQDPEAQGILAKAKDQALNGTPKCFEKAVEAVLFEQAQYQKLLLSSGDSTCSDQVFLRWLNCFTFNGPNSRIKENEQEW